jgi:hypothetical protein
MRHEREIATIISQVKLWPEEDRVALAHRILRDLEMGPPEPPPRNTLDRAIGIARGATPPPDDATVKKWIEEHHLRKYG